MLSAADRDNGNKRLAVRDNERFKLLFRNSRPQISGKKLAPVAIRSTRSLIGERLRALAAATCQK